MSSTAGVAVAGLAALFLIASPPGAKAATARSKACWAQADHKGLTGPERRHFHAACLQGALAPDRPTRNRTDSAWATAVTAPSGADRTQRSQQCAREAADKGDSENQRKAIRLSCMASAAPPSATGTPRQPPTPTPAKPEIDHVPPRN